MLKRLPYQKIQRLYTLLVGVIFFFFMGGSLEGKSEPEELKFRHLTIDNGLSQNAVFAILQDSKGFMWFGTKDGLNHYDGYSFTVYSHNPFDSTTLSSNYVTSLFEDSRGLIWIGTNNGDINIFSYQTGRFQHLQKYSSFLRGTKGSKITCITEDADSNMWVGTHGKGLFRLNHFNQNFSVFETRQFLYDPSTGSNPSNNYITSLFPDSGGVLWIGTSIRLCRLENATGKLSQYLFSSKDSSKNNEESFEPAVSTLFEDDSNRFWLGTVDGLILFDRDSGSWKVFKNRYEVFRRGWGIAEAICRGAHGKLWIASPAGLMRFDPANGKYEYFYYDPSNPYSLSYNIVTSLLHDKTGILWVGTSGGGINVYGPHSDRFSTLVRNDTLPSRISGFSVHSILEDRQGIVWIGSDVLYRWNRKTRELKSYETDSYHLQDFGNTSIWHMIQTADDFIWAASTEGLFKYNPVTQTATLFRHNPQDTAGVPEKNICTVFEDRDHQLWIVTEKFLSKMTDRQKGTFTHYRYAYEKGVTEILHPVLYQDRKKRFWIGTHKGLLLFDRQKGTFQSFENDPADPTSISSNLVKTICPDPFRPGEILWIGTGGGGLNRFDIENRSFHHYTEINGLPNNVVYGILPDSAGNLWLSTNKGLSRFNSQTDTFRNFDVNDGLQSNEFNTGAYFRSQSGELFFGGINGVNYFYPQKIQDNRMEPNIVITHLKTLNHMNDRSYTTTQDITSIHQITLPYKTSVLTFSFAALDYTAPEKNQYAYKLQNFNDHWIYSGASRTATYTNLSPGTYLFRVKGSNNDGIWNKKGASVLLTITPPWWATWWAYLSYGTLFLSLLYLIRKYELSRVKLKNRLRLEKIVTDSLRNIDLLKSRFFANISHEFRTPLTLILGQIESVMRETKKAKDKNKLKIADRNAKRLLTLINQLLDLSKIEAGSMELKADTFNIIPFLKNLFYSFETLAEDHRIKLKFETNADFIPVKLDPDKMEKVFYNLISNALKFTPGPGEIAVQLRMINETEVNIRIRDTGIGIHSKQLRYIFDLFYQADSSTTRKNEGTGIGLALAKELVSLHHGNITVKSEEGIGTEFVITLPLSNEVPADERAEVLVPHEISSPDVVLPDFPEKKFRVTMPDSTSTKEIILVVEDNRDVRSFICEHLKHKYRLLEASNGVEGWQLAQETIPDLIITDVMMPRMDGFQFCRRVRGDEKTSHIPIIILTAKAGIENKIEGLETGIDAYLTKPFSIKELKVRVKHLIRLRQQLRKRFSKSTIIKSSEVTEASVDQVFIEKVIRFIEERFGDETFGIEEVASHMHMSISQLNRKLNALINQPAGKLIRSLRLQRAADLLKQNAGSVAEICYRVGFNDQAYFSRAFKKQFGYSPTALKKSV
jgi:signal transduction histidine kinase/ligand-binding sensor domain-containing protein/AraC-like DNA-binding protein